MNRAIGIAAVMVMVCVAAGENPPLIGQLVDIGGRKLHIYYTGRSNPTVIVENGGAGFSFDWELVQSQVGRTTRICT